MTKASKKAFRSDAQLKHCSMPERCRLQKNTEDNYLMRWELIKMSEREEEFIKCIKEDPERAARILEFILALRGTSSETNPALEKKAV